MSSPETITIPRAEYDKMKWQISHLAHQLEQLRRMIHGAKSERFVPTDPDQGKLFELEAQAAEERRKQQITYTREEPKQKKQPLRTELPSHLNRVIEVIEPQDLPQGAKKIGELVTEILELREAELFVRCIVRPKYVVESTDEQTTIVVAELPSLPIPKGNAGASLLASLMVSKYVDHLPFYRQRQMFKRLGIDLPESTIGGWFNAVCQLLAPLYDVMRKLLPETDYLQVDESPMPVQTQDKPGATHKGYQWVYFDPARGRVLFDYNKSRGREGPRQMLKDFKGFLQTDGYSAYNNLKDPGDVTLLACMAHARRKFDQAKDNDRARAEQALNMFGELYKIERQASEQGLDGEARYTLRQQEAVPRLAEIKAWLEKNKDQVVPKSAMGQAIHYTLSLWPRLVRYTDQGRFEIDNNLIENTIRPLALGRKNYLFAGSHQAAQQAAIVYSLLGTCKLNNINPQAWLNDTLTKLPDWPANRLHELLPGYQQ